MVDVSKEEFDALKVIVDRIDERGTRGSRVILTTQRYKEIVWFGVIILVAIALMYLLIVYQVNLSQHRWCDTLDLLTKQSPKPDAKVLYDDFVKLRGEFGCG